MICQITISPSPTGTRCSADHTTSNASWSPEDKPWHADNVRELCRFWGDREHVGLWRTACQKNAPLCSLLQLECLRVGWRLLVVRHHLLQCPERVWVVHERVGEVVLLRRSKWPQFHASCREIKHTGDRECSGDRLLSPSHVRTGPVQLGEQVADHVQRPELGPDSRDRLHHHAGTFSTMRWVGAPDVRAPCRPVCRSVRHAQWDTRDTHRLDQVGHQRLKHLKDMSKNSRSSKIWQHSWSLWVTWSHRLLELVHRGLVDLAEDLDQGLQADLLVARLPPGLLLRQKFVQDRDGFIDQVQGITWHLPRRVAAGVRPGSGGGFGLLRTG